MIKNINGKDNTGRNHYDRNRKGNKITVLVNSIGIPVGIFLSPANIHDSKLIETSNNNSVIKMPKTKIVSDKGYINQKVKNKLKKTIKIKLIYPYRGKKVLKSIKILILFGFKTHILYVF